MKLTTLPNFTDLTTVLNNTELKLHASQVHGLICGVLCGNFNQQTDWMKTVMGENVTGETQEVLQALYNGTYQQLSEFLFDFQLISPDDDASLGERAESLGIWCQGFLTGLKVGGVPVVDREPSELTEAIDDLIEIAKMNYEEVVANDEDETAYVELLEYVRLAAIFIYQDLHEPEVCTHANHLH